MSDPCMEEGGTVAAARLSRLVVQRLPIRSTVHQNTRACRLAATGQSQLYRLKLSAKFAVDSMPVATTQSSERQSMQLEDDVAVRHRTPTLMQPDRAELLIHPR